MKQLYTGNSFRVGRNIYTVPQLLRWLPWKIQYEIAFKFTDPEEYP